MNINSFWDEIVLQPIITVSFCLSVESSTSLGTGYLHCLRMFSRTLSDWRGKRRTHDPLKRRQVQLAARRLLLQVEIPLLQIPKITFLHCQQKYIIAVWKFSESWIKLNLIKDSDSGWRQQVFGRRLAFQGHSRASLSWRSWAATATRTAILCSGSATTETGRSWRHRSGTSFRLSHSILIQQMFLPLIIFLIGFLTFLKRIASVWGIQPSVANTSGSMNCLDTTA